MVGGLALALGWGQGRAVRGLGLVIGLVLWVHHDRALQEWHEGRARWTAFGSPTIVEAPHAVVQEVEKTPSGYRVCFVLQEAHILGSPHALAAGARVESYLDQSFRRGERLSLRAIYYPEKRGRNFPLYDFEMALRNRQIQARVKVLSHQIHPSSSEPLLSAEKGRSLLRSRLHAGIEEDLVAKDLLSTLLLSERLFPQLSWLETFREVGAAHLFVASGLHVGILTGLLWFGLRLLRVGYRPALGIILFLMWSYAWLVGFEAPVVRTVFCLTLVMVGFLLRQRVTFLNSLSLGYLLLLLWDPFELYNVGFLLSFGVVLCLACLVRPLDAWNRPWLEPDAYLPKALWSKGQRRLAELKKWGASYLAVGLVAWLGSSLIIALCFGQVYFLGMLTSWVLVPFAALMMAVGWVSILLFELSPAGAKALNSANARLAHAGVQFVEHVETHCRTKWTLHPQKFREGVVVFDLGKGQSALSLGTSPGWLLGAENQWSRQHVVVPLFKRAGRMPFHLLLQETSPRLPSSGPAYFPSSLSASDLRARRYALGEGFFLTPYSGPPQAGRAADRAPVLRVEKDGWSLLYLGEAGLRTARYLWQHQKDLRADLLIAGVPQSGEEALEEFCALVEPRLVIQAASYYYREPRLSGQKIPVIDQGKEGAIYLKWSQDRLELHSADGTKRVLSR